jgi:hypothetical protein
MSEGSGVSRGEPGRSEFIGFVAVSLLPFVLGHRISTGEQRQSVNGANDDDGKFNTHSFSRRRFYTVFDLRLIPSIQDWFSHHAEDIGAKLAEPSSFKVLMRTTGVPK